MKLAEQLRHDGAEDQTVCPWCDLDGDINAHTEVDQVAGVHKDPEAALVSVADIGEDIAQMGITYSTLLCWCGHSLHLPDCEKITYDDDDMSCRCAERVAIENLRDVIQMSTLERGIEGVMDDLEASAVKVPVGFGEPPHPLSNADSDAAANTIAELEVMGYLVAVVEPGEPYCESQFAEHWHKGETIDRDQGAECGACGGKFVFNEGE